jgi:hypothetical protein
MDYRRNRSGECVPYWTDEDPSYGYDHSMYYNEENFNEYQWRGPFGYLDRPRCNSRGLTYQSRSIPWSYGHDGEVWDRQGGCNAGGRPRDSASGPLRGRPQFGYIDFQSDGAYTEWDAGDCYEYDYYPDREWLDMHEWR